MLAIVPPWRIPRRFWGGLVSGRLWRGRGNFFGGQGTYSVLFLHREFEIDGAAGCVSYSEL